MENSNSIRAICIDTKILLAKLNAWYFRANLFTTAHFSRWVGWYDPLFGPESMSSEGCRVLRMDCSRFEFEDVKALAMALENFEISSIQVSSGLNMSL